MAALTIRNLDDNLKIQLSLRAVQHGTSMEAEVRTILYQSLLQASSGKSFADRIHKRFEAIAVKSLPIPPRQVVRTPQDFREQS